MENIDHQIENAIRDGIRDGIKKKFESSYGNPLDAVLNKAIESHAAKFHKVLSDAIGGCLNDTDFTREIGVAVRQDLAKRLVQKFGGELEKQVNTLKSDPTTRARIIVALDEIVKSQTK